MFVRNVKLLWMVNAKGVASFNYLFLLNKNVSNNKMETELKHFKFSHEKFV
jgi:hypothetical protein